MSKVIMLVVSNNLAIVTGRGRGGKEMDYRNQNGNNKQYANEICKQQQEQRPLFVLFVEELTIKLAIRTKREFTNLREI
jgi:hypothetical protein